MEELEQQPKEKLLKVTMEFETYTQTLEGDKAQSWLDDVDSKIIFCTTTRKNPLKYHSWKRTQK